MRIAREEISSWISKTVDALSAVDKTSFSREKLKIGGIRVRNQWKRKMTMNKRETGWGIEWMQISIRLSHWQSWVLIDWVKTKIQIWLVAQSKGRSY